MSIPFTHRETILNDTPPPSAIIRAAYAVAKIAHLDSGQKREKQDFSYIVHPIMLYDLLVHFGEKDEITLACALLHDAREDGPAYKNNDDAMRQDLEEQLRKEGITDAEHIAGHIDEICGELKNDREMIEGKQTWQEYHAGHISLTACKVKLFDQMASILDNIMMPDNPGIKKGGEKWARKALGVVKAIAEERPQLAFYRDMFKVLFGYNQKILRAQNDGDAATLRGGFVWGTAVQEARRIFEAGKTHVVVESRLLHSRSQDIDVGVLQVGFDNEGKIVEYACLCNRQANQEEARNAVAIQFKDALDTSSTSRRVTLGKPQILDGRLVRINRIKPAIDASEFIALGLGFRAVEQSFATVVRDTVRARASQLPLL